MTKNTKISATAPLVLLFGGIGNRLFQIARALDLQKKGASPKVIAIEDIPELLFLVNRGLGWTQHHMWIDTLSLCRRMGLDVAQPLISIRVHLFYEISKLLWSDRKKKFDLHIDHDFRSVQIGYFQGQDCISVGSVKSIVHSLYNTLDLSGPTEQQKIVHIRGGDFKVANRLSTNMVKNFIRAHPDAICVTNDPNYVTANHPQLHLSLSKNAREDFIILANAGIILPSNSTFCFWACAIARQKNQATIWSLPDEPYWKLINQL